MVLRVYDLPDDWGRIHNQPMNDDFWESIAEQNSTHSLRCVYHPDFQALLVRADDTKPHLHHGLITNLADVLRAVEIGCRRFPLSAFVIDSIDDGSDPDEEDSYLEDNTDDRPNVPLLARSFGCDWPERGDRSRRLSYKQATKPFIDTIESLQRLGEWNVSTVAAGGLCDVRGPALSIAMACDWFVMNDLSETSLEDPIPDRYHYIAAISMTARRAGVIEAAKLLSGTNVHGPVQETFFNKIVDELTRGDEEHNLVQLLRPLATFDSMDRPQGRYVGLLIDRKSRMYVSRAQIESDLAAGKLWIDGNVREATMAYIDLLVDLGKGEVDRRAIEKAATGYG